MDFQNVESVERGAVVKDTEYFSRNGNYEALPTLTE
jgi:hypothetical protein